ncbi:hypothetical protein ACO0LB_15035 [Undibacterium sp. SXout7W]|uniref:hypothetical protein n=1 Tax=Undibacterium sp. SXout7W TaxID=3413049 RepID=UPI003BF0A8E9
MKMIETPTSLHTQPINVQLELFGFGIALATLLTMAVYRPQFALIIFFPLILSFAWRRYRDYKRYGANGKPAVSVSNQTLYIDRPNDSRSGVAIPLEQLRHVIVYGPRSGRIYRLINVGGTCQEVKPDWNETLHGKVSDFLVRALPGKVSIEEPQTLMASIRADGPETKV